MAIASQPRCPGATADTSRSAADEVENLLRSAGFTQMSTETLPLSPPVICVLAAAPGPDADHAPQTSSQHPNAQLPELSLPEHCSTARKAPARAACLSQRLGSDRGSPNDGSTLFSKRVMALIRSPVRVRT